MVRVAFVGSYFSKCKIARVLYGRILADIFRLRTVLQVYAIRWADIRVLGEKPMCNSTGEISSTYFPITLADLDSNGTENILIVRLHG